MAEASHRPHGTSVWADERRQAIPQVTFQPPGKCAVQPLTIQARPEHMPEKNPFLGK
jgi:hypothetical protein